MPDADHDETEWPGRVGPPLVTRQPRTYVVMECRIAQDPHQLRPAYTAWAWCECRGDGPGFTDVSYTHQDGINFVEIPPGGVSAIMGRVVFTVTVW
jgi:hypothetical protein